MKTVKICGQEDYCTIIKDDFEEDGYQIIGHGKTKEEAMQMALENCEKVLLKTTESLEKVLKILCYREKFDLSDDLYLPSVYVNTTSFKKEQYDIPDKFSYLAYEKETGNYYPYYL